MRAPLANVCSGSGEREETNERAARTVSPREIPETVRRLPGRSLAMRCVSALALGITLLTATGLSAARAAEYTLPLFTSADNIQQGFARIINRSDRAGTVSIYGTDDEGRSHGPVTLHLDARATRHFNSVDLEQGNTAKGLSEGIGDGEGSWRLRLETDLDIEPAAYIHTPDGFFASVHDVVHPAEVGGETVYRVPIFNPGSDRDQASWLRLVNLSEASVEVTIRGRDDAGDLAPGGEVRLTLPSGAARRISALQLETGGAGLSGRLGDGEGKWQLFVQADGDIEVVSLLRTPAGHLTNLSASNRRPVEELTAAGSVFRDCPECPEMVVVPAGSYLMGSPASEEEREESEGPVRRVTISDPFAVGIYEVTLGEWDACRSAGGCSARSVYGFSHGLFAACQARLRDGLRDHCDPSSLEFFYENHPRHPGDGDEPVLGVRWEQAQQYVRWLSEKTGKPYRLLSESEWEYVARAGTTTRYWWGDEIGEGRANCDGCGSPWEWDRGLAPVGSFAPNPFGLHDVHGNVWEWVEDCWLSDYRDSPTVIDGGTRHDLPDAPRDGSARKYDSCSSHVARGGGRLSPPHQLRSASRGVRSGTSKYEFNGFRIARSFDPPANRHTLPFFRAAGGTRQGFARVINRSDRAGTVRIYGTDDIGQRRGPVTLQLDSNETRHFSSRELEEGDAGLSSGLGDGSGDWRLELVSELDIEPLAYIRTTDGFLAAMHDAARTVDLGGTTVHRVPIFNPGSNRERVSWLRLANLTDRSVDVTIQGMDDAGESAPGGDVALTLPPGAARLVSAQQLESGNASLLGRLGDGSGMWQLFVTADGDIEVVSLLQSPTGHLSNLSVSGLVELEIATSSPDQVEPLERIALQVSGGLSRKSDYTVLIDVTGAGTFEEGNVIEVPGFTTDRDEVLFAAPMPQVLSPAPATLPHPSRIEHGRDEIEHGQGEGRQCDPWRMCAQTLTCVDGLQYPTACGPNNCDEPIGVCPGTEPRQDEGDQRDPWEQISCTDVVTCVDGLQYPTGCGPDYGDEPIGVCPGVETGPRQGDGGQCDPWQICGQALTCVDGMQYPSTCGPANCDEPIGVCPGVEAEPRQFSVRLRRELDGRLSNALQFSVKEVEIAEDLAGLPIAVLDTLLHLVFTHSDDEVLNRELDRLPPPGRLADLSRRLRLDTSFSDALAEALLVQLFSVSVVELTEAIEAADNANDEAATGPDYYCAAEEADAMATSRSGPISEDPIGCESVGGDSADPVVPTADGPELSQAVRTVAPAPPPASGGGGLPSPIEAGLFTHEWLTSFFDCSGNGDDAFEKFGPCSKKLPSDALAGWRETETKVKAAAAAGHGKGSLGFWTRIVVKEGEGAIEGYFNDIFLNDIVGNIAKALGSDFRSNKSSSENCSFHFCTDMSGNSHMSRRGAEDIYRELRDQRQATKRRWEQRLRDEQLSEALAKLEGDDLREDAYWELETIALDQAFETEEIEDAGESYITGEEEDPVPPGPKDQKKDPDTPEPDPGNGDQDPEPPDPKDKEEPPLPSDRDLEDKSTVCTVSASISDIPTLMAPDVECEDVGTEETVQGSVGVITRFYLAQAWVRLGDTRLWRRAQEIAGYPQLDVGECELLVDPVIDNGLTGGPVPSRITFISICPAEDGNESPAKLPAPKVPPGGETPIGGACDPCRGQYCGELTCARPLTGLQF